MNNQNLLEYVTSNLKAQVGSWPKIAKKTGVPYHTITKIASGKTKDPGISKVQSLVDYFRELEHPSDKAA